MRLRNVKIEGIVQTCTEGKMGYFPAELNVEYTRDNIGESLSIQFGNNDDFIGLQIPFKELRRMINGK